MSFLWASATASAVNPPTLLWWSMNSGIAPLLLSRLPKAEQLTRRYDRTHYNNGSSKLVDSCLSQFGKTGSRETLTSFASGVGKNTSPYTLFLTPPSLVEEGQEPLPVLWMFVGCDVRVTFQFPEGGSWVGGRE